MLSRTLSLATVTLLIGCCAAAPSPALAQATNLEAGKSPSQIFAGTCNACHKSPRGLLKTVPAGSLQGFLRQHYTTSPEMASLLSSFLISNGATDTRYVGPQAKPAKDAKSDAGPSALPDHIDRFGRRVRPPPPQEAAKPDSEPQQAAKPEPEGVPPQAEAAHAGRNAKRLARPGEPAEAAKPAADSQAPAQAALEHGPDGRKAAGKQKLSKRGRPGGEELPKADAVKEEPAKGEAPQEDKPKGETAKDEGSKPPGEGKSESAKVEAPKESGSGSTPPVLRADPVPPVTPAPSAMSAAVSGSTPEPAPSAAPVPATAPAPAAPPAVTASVPPPALAGPPAPPISQ
jgi:hypothetical protein